MIVDSAGLRGRSDAQLEQELQQFDADHRDGDSLIRQMRAKRDWMYYSGECKTQRNKNNVI